MSSNLYLSLLSFLITAFLIHVFREPATNIGLVDNPGGRKHHEMAIPLIGGLAIFCAFLFSSLLIDDSLHSYKPLFAGMGILLITGIFDDIQDLPPITKIVFQLIAVIILISWDGKVIENLGDLLGLGNIVLGNLSVPFTILCVIGLINSVNMIDGMDGLAGGVIFTNFIAILLLSFLISDVEHVTLLLILCSALFSFLLFNFRGPWRICATIFMGDAGSMMLGFALAWFAIDIFLNTQSHIYPITFAYIFALPIFDAITLIIRRIIKRKSPLSADREHIHHIFLRAGYSYNTTVYGIISLNILYAAIGIAGWYFGVPEPFMFIFLIICFSIHLYFVMHAWRFMRALKRLHNFKE
jgi:UDP-GlcNAc:undecaprenyl-phosphate GlcNAc-1-phosphate transferase